MTSTAFCELGDSATGVGFIRTGSSVVNTSGLVAGGNSCTVAGALSDNGENGDGENGDGDGSLQATAQCFVNSHEKKNFLLQALSNGLVQYTFVLRLITSDR